MNPDSIVVGAKVLFCGDKKEWVVKKVEDVAGFRMLWVQHEPTNRTLEIMARHVVEVLS